MSQAMVTVSTPIAAARIDEAIALIRGLGNPASTDVAAALDELDGNDGIHFASLHAIPPGDPQPFALCVAADDTVLILLEEAPGLQRVRTLEYRSTASPENTDPNAPKASEWAVTLSKTIRTSEDLSARQGNERRRHDRCGAGATSVELLFVCQTT